MNLKNIWSDEAKLRRVFTWLTRIGAAHKFGSIPIGWYQQHQCAAIKYLEENRGCKDKEMRCQGGSIQSRCPDRKTWMNEISARGLYDRADTFCRTGKF